MEKQECEVFIENKSLYSNDITKDEWEENYNYLSNVQDCLIGSSNHIVSTHVNIKDHIFTGYDFYIQMNYSSFSIEEIDSVEYIYTFDQSVLKETDFKELVDYKEIKVNDDVTHYLFKYDDFIKKIMGE